VHWVPHGWRVRHSSRLIEVSRMPTFRAIALLNYDENRLTSNPG
jgi:hypothetical protein